MLHTLNAAKNNLKLPTAKCQMLEADLMLHARGRNCIHLRYPEWPLAVFLAFEYIPHTQEECSAEHADLRFEKAPDGCLVVDVLYGGSGQVIKKSRASYHEMERIAAEYGGDKHLGTLPPATFVPPGMG
jgi:hypothetical protein